MNRGAAVAAIRTAVLAAALALSGAAPAQINLLPPTSPSGPAPAPSLTWTTLYTGPLGDLQIANAPLELTAGTLVYRVRDGRRQFWAAAQCAAGRRTELAAAAYGASPPEAAALAAPDVRWTTAERGTRAQVEVLAACALARRRGMAVDGAAPDWSADDVAALSAAWQHTAGGNAYDFQVAYFANERDARLAARARWGNGTRILPVSYRVDSLVDVPPELRHALAATYSAGTRSKTFAVKGVSGQTMWALLHVTTNTKSRRAANEAEFRQRAQAWVAAGHLPPPAELRSDPQHKARAAYWLAMSDAAALRALPREFNPNLRFGNESTPLLHAVLLDNEEAARALRERGARLDDCAHLGCATHVALYTPDAARRRAWLDWLLAAGARADAFDPAFEGASSTALTLAALRGDVASVNSLMQGGAHADGLPGVATTPLEGALAANRRDIAEMLLQRGARVLPFADRSEMAIGRGNAYRAAMETKNEALLQWVQGQMLAAARNSPDYALKVHLEQDGKRIELRDGAAIALRAAAFKLVVQPGGPGAVGVVMAASLEAGFAAEAVQARRGNGLMFPSRSGALAEPPDPASFELLAYSLRPTALAEDGVWGGHMHLGFDPAVRKDFHEVRPAATAGAAREHVREVRSLLVVPEAGDIPPAQPLSTLAGKSLVLVVGTSLVLDPIDWAPLVHWRSITLNLR